MRLKSKGFSLKWRGKRVARWIALSLVATGCGFLDAGGFPVLRDPVPDGQIVSIGKFTSVNTGFHENKSVNGNVQVYRTAPETYVIRLEYLEAPQESSLQLIVEAGATTVLSTSLRSPFGHQNYTVSVAGSPQWSAVRIRTPTVADPVLADYGVAVMETQ